MVQSNTQELARFGGTATNGAKMIGEFSRDVRLGIGQRFFEMGMTIESMNESMISYMSLETMRGRRSIRNDAQTRDAAANYINELDQLAKLTGQQRDALMETQAALQTDAQIRNQLARVQRAQGDAAMENLRSIYTLQQTAVPGFHDALLDLSDGVAQSDMARVLQQNVRGLDRFMLSVAQGNVTQEEYVSYMANNVEPVMRRYTEGLDDATLQVMRGAGGFYSAMAEAADGGHEWTRFANMNTQAGRAEQARRGAVTQYLARFEQSLQAVRSFIIDQFLRSDFAGDMAALFEDLQDGMTGANGIVPAMRNAITWAMDVLFSDSGIVTRSFRWLSEFIRSDRFKGALTRLGEGFRAVGNYFSGMYDEWSSGTSLWDIFVGEIGSFGSLIAQSFRDLMDNEQLRTDIKDAFVGMFTHIGEAFNAFWQGPVGLSIQNTIEGYFLEIRDHILSWIRDLPVIGGQFEVAAIEASQDNFMSNLANRSPDQSRSMTGHEIATRISELMMQQESALGWFGRETDASRLIGRQIQELQNYSANSFATGTNGFQNFGSGTPAMLHNTEAVVPRHTPAGDALADFYQNQSSRSFSGGGDQSEVVNKLNELNSNIVRLLRTTEVGVGYQQRTAKGVKGMGTDLFKGAGAR